MPSITLQNMTTLVNTMSAKVQADCNALVDFTIGSPMLAMVEAYAGVALLLQYIAIVILQATRLETSQGSDVDSFLADYGLTRVAGSAATTLETFYRIDATNPAFIPVGFTVISDDFQFRYDVVADPTNAYWDPITASQYIIPAGTFQASITIQAEQPGTDYNVTAGTITQTSSTLFYIDGVKNPNNVINGIAAETDAQAKARFQNFLASRATANSAAIIFAAESQQAGLMVVLHENTNTGGTTLLGTGTLIVDDGSGATPSALLQQVSAAVAAVRGLNTNTQVMAPSSILGITISLNLAVKAGASKPAVSALIAAAITAYVNTIPPEQTCYYYAVASAIAGASSDIATVTNLLVNGGTVDVVPPNFAQVVKLTGTPAIT